MSIISITICNYASIVHYFIWQYFSLSYPALWIYILLCWSPLICTFAFHSFSYPESTAVQKYYVENSRNKRFISFKSHTILRLLMKFHTILLRPARDSNCAFVLLINAADTLRTPIGHLEAIFVIRVTVTVTQCLCSCNLCFT